MIKYIVAFLLFASTAHAQAISPTLHSKIVNECAGGWAAFKASIMGGMPQPLKDIAQPWVDYCGPIRAGTGFPDGTSDATPAQIIAAKAALVAAAAEADVYIPKPR